MKKPIQTENAVEENAVNGTPAHEQIAVRAYELWVSRGCPEGSPELDWLQAEAELTEIRPESQSTAA
jgi:hypothetical protein